MFNICAAKTLVDFSAPMFYGLRFTWQLAAVWIQSCCFDPSCQLSCHRGFQAATGDFGILSRMRPPCNHSSPRIQFANGPPPICQWMSISGMPLFSQRSLGQTRTIAKWLLREHFLPKLIKKIGKKIGRLQGWGVGDGRMILTIPIVWDALSISGAIRPQILALLSPRCSFWACHLVLALSLGKGCCLEGGRRSRWEQCPLMCYIRGPLTKTPPQIRKYPQKHRVYTDIFEKFARTFAFFHVTQVRNLTEIVQKNLLRRIFVYIGQNFSDGSSSSDNFCNHWDALIYALVARIARPESATIAINLAPGAVTIASQAEPQYSFASSAGACWGKRVSYLAAVSSGV